MKHASNVSLLGAAVGVLLAFACSTAHRERAPGDQRVTEFQDPVDSLIDSMVKDRSTWVDPPWAF
jgi:hypothetical protein